MRSPTGLVAALLLALASGCTSGGAGAGAAASCVGPQVTVSPAEVAVGDDVLVSVEWLREGCNDHTGADEEQPLTDVPVSFVQGDTTVLLGTVSGTGDRYTGSLTAAVPVTGVPGAATVTVLHGNAAPLTVLP
jgi:hypothetical protein